MGCAFRNLQRPSSNKYGRNASLDAAWNIGVTREITMRENKGPRRRSRPILRFLAACEGTRVGLSLFGLGDYSASDARWRSAGGARGDCVNDHRGSAIAEDGVIVGSQCDVWCDDGGMRGTVGGDD